MSRVLFVWPPKLEDNVSTFRHMVYFGETVGYIARDNDVKVMDGAVLKHYLKEFIVEYAKGYDVISMQIEPHNIEAGLNASMLAKSISPSTQIIVFGTAACINPGFFIKQEFVDAVCYTGNYEYGIKAFIERVAGEPNHLTDIMLKGVITPRGRSIPASEWAYPAWELLPLDDYMRAHHEREGRIGVSRGCVHGCRFCKQTFTMGREERYRDVGDVVDNLLGISDKFDVLSVAATNFGYNREWAEEFCMVVKQRNAGFRWNTMTRVECLDESLVSLMAGSGCYKIGFGVETLNPETQRRIGKVVPEDMIRDVIGLLHKHEIIPRACIMVGIPGQTREEIVYTMSRLSEWGASIRAKEYYPYGELACPNLSLDTIRRFDRTDYYHYPIEGLSKEEFIRIIFLNEIPGRSARLPALCKAEGGEK